MENREICHCMGVTFADVEDAMHSMEKFSDVLDTFKHVQEATSCSTGFPSILILRILFGCMKVYSSFFTVLSISTILDTLIPPPVLPAHAPINIRSTRINLEVSGHRLKSVVEKPVVVIIDATWKDECLSVSSIPLNKLKVLKNIIAMAAAIMMK